MSTTVTFKLNKDAHQFQAGDSVGFGIRGGVQYYDRQTKQKEWTNYEAAIFARNEGQIQFYQQSLVAGSVVEITGKTQKIRQFDGQNGLILSIEILEASVGLIHTGNAPQQAPAQRPAAPQQYQQPAQPQQPGQPVAPGQYQPVPSQPPAPGQEYLDPSLDIPF